MGSEVCTVCVRKGAVEIDFVDQCTVESQNLWKNKDSWANNGKDE